MLESPPLPLKPPGLRGSGRCLSMMGAWMLITMGAHVPGIPGVARASADSADHKQITVTVAVAVDSVGPSAITDLEARPTSHEGEIELRWQATGDDGASGRAADYLVKVSSNPISAAEFAVAAAYPQDWTPLPSGETETRLITGLAPRTTHYFAVKARDLLLNTGGWASALDSPGTNPLNFAYALEIPPAAITDLAAAPGASDGSVQLSWTSPGDDDTAGDINGGRYRIDYSTDPAARLTGMDIYQLEFSTDAGAGQSQSTRVNGLSPGTTYYFRLYALDERLNGSASNLAVVRAGRTATRPVTVDFSPGYLLPGIISSNVRPGDPVTVTFNEPMDPSSLASAFRLRAILDNGAREIDEIIPGELIYEGLQLRFIPSQPLKKNFTYEISLSTAALDIAGDALARELKACFRTVLDPNVDNVIRLPDEKTTVTIPAGSLAEESYLQMAATPLRVSLQDLADSIREANQKERDRSGGRWGPVTDTVREFRLISAATGKDVQASAGKPMELRMPYDDPDGDGFIEGAGFKIHERFLGISVLDEEARLWVQIPGSRVDRQSRAVTARILHFSVYTVMPAGTGFIGGAYAYPVPFVPTRGHSRITFTNLSTEATVRIYSLSGELVRELTEGDGDGQLEWDVKNGEGADVFSGVYIYLIKNGGEKKTGKLVIIR